jgi:hypothetical protein
MSGPTGDVEATFIAFVSDFNAAQSVGDYRNILQYLSSHVTMHKVDDPSAVSGNPTAIVSYLNGSQKGVWPRFDSGTINSPNGGTITGSGFYTDNTVQRSTPIPVKYSFRFRPVSNVWLISLASASPYTPIA